MDNAKAPLVGMESVHCIKHKCFAQTNHVSLHHQLTSYRSDTGLVTATHAQAEEGMQLFEKQKRTVPEPKIYHFHHPEDSLPMSPGSSGWNSGYCLWLILLPSSQEHLWYINPQKKSLNLVQHFHSVTLPVFLEQNTFFPTPNFILNRADGRILQIYSIQEEINQVFNYCQICSDSKLTL